MTKLPAIRSLARSLVFLAIGTVGASTALAEIPIGRALLGHWEGPRLDKVPGPDGSHAYLRRSVRFTADGETLRLEGFADEKATMPLFTYESDGPYELLGRSSAVSGAHEINLTNHRSLMTIHVANPDLWKGLNLGACPLEIGKAVEISGCVSGPPFNASNCLDLDLVHIDAAGALRFGDQSTDRCAKRPDKLDRAYFVRARD